MRHTGRGPTRALALSVLLALLSVVLHQAAYAAAPPYPGPPGLPGIPPGPSLGCHPANQTGESWICGFDALSTVTFKVDGQAAGTSQADSNGCVLVVVTFLHGNKVSVNGNDPVKVKPGTNFLIVVGVKTRHGLSQSVGRRLPFQTPDKSNNFCNSLSPPPTIPPPSTIPQHGGGFPGRPTTTLFPTVTTAHGYTPTTLAWVIKNPLSDSPNRVILQSSLIAAVLAAVVAAGALGAMWSGGDRAGGGSEDDGAPGGQGDGPAGPEGPPPPPGASGPPPPPPPQADNASAFQRGATDAPGGGAT